MFVTDGQIQQDIADALKTSLSNLPAWVANVVARCHTAAYQEIVGRLMARGFTKAQIDSWDRGSEYERSISIALVFYQPQAAGVFDKEAVSMWDRRKELDNVVLFINGVIQAPVTGATQGGTVGVGSFDTSNDLFPGYASPNDPRRGDDHIRW